jgi:hypothetical protein
MSTEEERVWISAWRSAGPELQRIRKEELRSLDDTVATLQATMLGVLDPVPARGDSGLKEFQVWMKKWRSAQGV